MNKDQLLNRFNEILNCFEHLDGLSSVIELFHYHGDALKVDYDDTLVFSVYLETTKLSFRLKPDAGYIKGRIKKLKTALVKTWNGARLPKARKSVPKQSKFSEVLKQDFAQNDIKNLRPYLDIY